MKRARWLLLLHLFCWPLLAGCGGTKSDAPPPLPTASPSPSPSPVTIQGTAKYKDMLVTRKGLTPNPSDRPIRRARVELVRQSDGTALTPSTFADEQGHYSFARPAGEAALSTYVRVRAQRAVSGEMDVRVANSTGDVYAVVSSAGTGSRTVNLTAGRSRPGTDVAGPFNIYDQFLSAADTVHAAESPLALPALTYVWEEGKADGTFYYPGVRQIYVNDQPPTDTDEFDDPVILHETGHYFAKEFLKDESSGGGHAIGDYLDPRVAFSEGWGDFFAGAAQNPPANFYIDTDGGSGVSVLIELEGRTTGDSVTYESETAVAQVFWDLFDDSARSTDGDNLDLGFAAIWTAMRQIRSHNDPFVYLHTFLDRTTGLTAAEINQNFNGGIVGPPDLDISSPPYWTPWPGDPTPYRTAFPQLRINVGETKLDSVTGGPNDQALSLANAFYYLNVVTAGTLTITLQPNAGEDLDLFLYGPTGALLASSSTHGTGQPETISRPSVTAGEYMIQVQAVSANNRTYTLSLSGTAASNSKPAPAAPAAPAAAGGKPGQTLRPLLLNLRPADPEPVDAAPPDGSVALVAEVLTPRGTGRGEVRVTFQLPEGLRLVAGEREVLLPAAETDAGAVVRLTVAAERPGSYTVTAVASYQTEGAEAARATDAVEIASGAAAGAKGGTEIRKPQAAGAEGGGRLVRGPSGERIIEYPAIER